MNYKYENSFFDYIEGGSFRSAKVFVEEALNWLKPASVMDLGCGRGAWLAAWREAGVDDLVGVDGDYVDTATLLFPSDGFRAADLSKPLDIGRKFDLAQSLEVAEHLPPEAAEAFVDSLCRHADIVLFSAAVVGQGGENHLNERPLEYWRQLFRAGGFEPYDSVRPVVQTRRDVEPWYRFNAVLYANSAGRTRLPAEVLTYTLEMGQPLLEGGSFSWRVRRALVSFLPQEVVTFVARERGKLRARHARAKRN